MEAASFTRALLTFLAAVDARDKAYVAWWSLPVMERTSELRDDWKAKCGITRRCYGAMVDISSTKHEYDIRVHYIDMLVPSSQELPSKQCPTCDELYIGDGDVCSACAKHLANEWAYHKRHPSY